MYNELIYKEESYRIIGIAMEVHKILGPVFLESVYEEAMYIELKKNNIPFKRQTEIDVKYKK